MSCYDISNYLLFQHLTIEEKNNLTSNTSRIKFGKGEKIVKCGGLVTHVIFVEKGYVKIHTDVKNKEFILNISKPGSLVCLSLMISSEKHFFSISALEDSFIHLIDIKYIREQIERNGKFAHQLIDCINRENTLFITHNMLSFTQNNMHGRLASALLYLSEHVFCMPKFDIILSRVELSNFCIISRENVIKILYEFNKEGIIILNGKQIEIINPDLLRRLTENC